ncbi:MAG: MlaD family protein [Planctomycetota bacterium]|jgi:ABC-type transporter Mla subunit MlaD
MHAKGDELKAGIVVVGATIALLVLLFFATGGSIWGDYRYLHARVELGKLAPEVGDPVMIHGVDLGKVDEVVLRTEIRRGDQLTEADREALGEAGAEGGEAAIREIYAHAILRLPADQEIPDGSWGEISEGITESRSVHLRLGHSLRNLTDADTERSPIHVRQAVGFASLAAKIGDFLDKADSVLDDLGGVATGAQDLLAEAKGLVVDVRSKVNQVDVEGMTGDVREAAAVLRRTLENAEKRIEAIAANIEAASSDIRNIGETGSRVATGVERDLAEILGTLKEVAGKLDGILERAAPKVDLFLDEMNRTAGNLVSLSEELEGIGPEARAFIAAVGRDVDELMATLLDTGHNLSDASEDLRAHPWKLLNEPSTDQIAYENVRNAFQNYVRVMREMNSAASRMREILQSPAPLDADDQAVLRQTVAEFESARDRYRAVEQRLMEILEATAPPSAPARPR